MIYCYYFVNTKAEFFEVAYDKSPYDICTIVQEF